MNMKMLVSTIIPVFNRSRLLREAVDSVLAQTYRPIEIIIVDDGSTDDTSEVIRELQASEPKVIRSIRQRNLGPGSAREAGRKVARGEFIQYLDSDDLLLPEKFQLQVKGLIENPDCGVSYGKTRHYRRGENPTDQPWRRSGEIFESMFPTFLESRVWSTVTPLYNRGVTDKAGPWTSLRQEEDWEYDCRIAAQGIKLHYVSSFIADQRMHDGPTLSGSWQHDKKALNDRLEARRMIYRHALNFGLNHKTKEIVHFAKENFLLCRQCGFGGYIEESKQFFDLAMQAAGSVRGLDIIFRLYSYSARIWGWRSMGMLAHLAERFIR